MKKFLAINAVALPVIAALIVGGAYSGGFFALGRFFELFGDFRQCALAFRLPTPCEAFFRALDLSALAMLAVQPRSKRYFCMALVAFTAWIACFFSGEFFILYIFRAVLYSAPALLFMKGAPFEKSVKVFPLAFAVCFVLGAAFNFEPAKYVRDFARAQFFPRGSDEVAEGLKEQVLANFAFSAADIFSGESRNIGGQVGKAAQLGRLWGFRPVSDIFLQVYGVQRKARAEAQGI